MHQQKIWALARVHGVAQLRPRGQIFFGAAVTAHRITVDWLRKKRDGSTAASIGMVLKETNYVRFID